MLWRVEVAQILKDEQATPNDFLEFIRRERLSYIAKTQSVESNSKNF